MTMAGVGVFAWLAIGAAAGWVITRLMVGAEDDALRGTAAGMVGGILGGLGMRLLDASPEAPQLNASLGALAGSLWLTWTTCVVTSGRRRDPAAPRYDARGYDVRVTVGGSAPEVRSTRPTLTDTVAADLEDDRDVTDAPVVARFDVRRRLSLGNRMQTLAARVRV